MGLMDFLKSALPVDANAQSGFTIGAREYAERDAISRELQERRRLENFRKMEMNNQMPTYDIDQLQGQIDTGLADVRAGLDTSQAPTGPQQKVTPEVKVEPEVGLDGTSVLAPKSGGVVDETENVPLESQNQTYPDVGPDTMPDKTLGPEYAKAAQEERLRRRKIIGQLRGAGLLRSLMGPNTQGGKRSAFYGSDEIQQFIFQNPKYLDEILADPDGFMERYQSEKGARTTNQVIKNSTERTDTLIASRKKRLADDVLYKKQAAEIVRAANDMGVDPIAALAIAGIESDFGANTGKSAKGARGAMQVMPDQAARLKKWFGDPANRDQVNKAFTSRDGFVNRARVEEVLRKINAAKPGSLEMGMAQLIYNKAIGLDKSLWGAGYQGNANDVLKAKKPLAIDDGNISNSDYNRAYVDLYNDIITNHGAKLAQTYGNLADLDLAQIQGTGVGRPLLKQVPGISRPVIVQKDDADVTTRVAQGTLTGGSNTDPFFDGDEGDGTGEAVVDNTGRSMGVNPQGVTDSGAGLKKDKSETDKIIKKPEDAPKIITKLAENPNRLGFEFQEALKTRNIIAQRIENMRRAGLTGMDTPEFAKGMADLMVLDSSLYVMQAYDSLYQFNNTGNPSRLNAVLDAFTGGSMLVQARNDGKFDLIRPDGTPISEDLTGLSMNEVNLKTRTVFDSKYRSTIESAKAESNMLKFKSMLKQAEEKSKINSQAMADMLKEAAKAANLVETKDADNGRIIYTTKGGQLVGAVEQKQVIEEVDGVETPITKYVEIPIDQISMGGATNSYMAQVANIGK